MEIEAKVYAAAKGEDNLKRIYDIMQDCVNIIAQEGFYFSKPIGISGWLELEEREYYTYRFNVSEDDDWKTMLERVGEELGEDGVVIVVYSSPDSDTFEEHAASTASGNVIFCDTEYDFSDFENFDKRLDEFKKQFVGSYKLGEALYQWFTKEEITAIPVETEEKSIQKKGSTSKSSSNVGCVCASFTLLFDNKQILAFSAAQRDGTGDEFEDCFYYRIRNKSINLGMSVGALFSKLSEERENIEAIKELLKDCVDPEKLELLADATVIIDGKLDLCACVSKGNRQGANPFTMLGMKNIPNGADLHDIIQIAHQQGLEKYYDDTLEVLYDRRNKGSQSFLFYFYEDEDILVETGDGLSYKKESLKLDDLGSILKARYKIDDIARDSEHGFDYTSELVDDVVKWAKAKNADLDVSNDMDPVQLLNKLGISARIEDNGYGTDVLKAEGEVVCSELPNSFLELVVILMKHVEYYWDCEIEATFEKQQGTVDIEVREGHLFVKPHESDEE